MERGALIGGAVVVSLLGVFAGLFVAMNLTDGTEPADLGTPRSAAVGEDGQPLAIPAIPTRPDGTPDPDAANAQVGALDTDAAQSKRLGGEEWARRRAERELLIQARAKQALETYLVGKSEVDADILRDTFDHLFVTSSAIREDMKSGAITLPQGRAEMTRLRTDTTRTVTDTVGPEGVRELRDALKRADAPLF